MARAIQREREFPLEVVRFLVAFDLIHTVDDVEPEPIEAIWRRHAIEQGVITDAE